MVLCYIRTSSDKHRLDKQLTEIQATVQKEHPNLPFANLRICNEGVKSGVSLDPQSNNAFFSLLSSIQSCKKNQPIELFIYDISRLVRNEKTKKVMVDLLSKRRLSIFCLYIGDKKTLTCFNNRNLKTFQKLCTNSITEGQMKRDRNKRKSSKDFKGGRSNFGYIKEYEKNNKMKEPIVRFIINPKEAELIRLVFHFYHQGLNSTEILKEMAKHGHHLNRKNNPYSVRTIQTILSHKDIYLGYAKVKNQKLASSKSYHQEYDILGAPPKETIQFLN
jgi:DNA invertase Pin-like site-specific DNA recombinase